MTIVIIPDPFSICAWAANITQWDEILLRFSLAETLLSLDRIGHDLSKWQKPYGLHYYSQVALA